MRSFIVLIVALVASARAETDIADAAQPKARDQLPADDAALARRQAPTPTQTLNIPQTQGTMSMVYPPITASASLFKIPPTPGQGQITFRWSYSDVIATPTSLTLQAYCSQNGYSYPIGPTSGIPGSQTTYAWDIASYQAAAGATPLIQASYTFRAFDQRGFLATPAPGLMNSQNGPLFMLYSPQPYQPLADPTGPCVPAAATPLTRQCAQCSPAAVLRSASPAMLALLASTVALIGGGYGVFARLR